MAKLKITINRVHGSSKKHSNVKMVNDRGGASLL